MNPAETPDQDRSALPSRRAFTAGVAATCLVPSSLRGAPSQPTGLAGIEQGSGGRLGVFAFSPSTGESIGHRQHERFRLCSTFKAPLAALTLHRVDAGSDHLDAPVAVRQSDMLPHSPVVETHSTLR